MSRAKFGIIAAALICNLVALLLLAWLAFRKQTNLPTAARAVSIQLGERNVQNGISLQEWDKDGANEPANVAGLDCRTSHQPPDRRYLYFAIDPSFKSAELMNVLVTVEYFDHAPGEFRLNYDGADPTINKADTYRTAQSAQKCLGSQQWLKAHFVASYARFKNSENGGSDFRLEIRAPELSVRRVAVVRLDDFDPSEPK